VNIPLHIQKLFPDFTGYSQDDPKDVIIRDLRYQISALRRIAEDTGMTDKDIDVLQMAHRPKINLN
jgi:hypothetical protein